MIKQTRLTRKKGGGGYAKAGGKSLLRRMREHWELYLFLLAAVLYLGIFHYAPMYGIQIAFRNFNPALGITGSRWVGLRHFMDFIDGYYFWRLIRNTLTLSIYSTLVGFPFPILLALMLNELKSYRYRKFVQTVLYAPHFISTVVMAGIITVMLSPSMGIVNTALAALGLERQYFMTNPAAFRHIYVWSGVWQNLGWGAIIYLAALSAVDPELHEAARIDGASRFQRILHINLPTIRPTIIILLIMSVGSIASVGFEKAFLLQNSLNIEVSDIIATYVYKRGIEGGNFSSATAVGLFNNLVNIVMLLLANFVAHKFSDTSLF